MDVTNWINTAATHGLAFIFLSITALAIASIFMTLSWLLIRIMRTMPTTISDWLKADAEMRREITASWGEIRRTLHGMTEKLQAVDHTTRRTHSALRHTVHAAKHIVHSLVPDKNERSNQAQDQLRQAEERLE